MSRFLSVKAIIFLAVSLALSPLCNSQDIKELWKQKGGTIIPLPKNSEETHPGQSIRDSEKEERRGSESSPQPKEPDHRDTPKPSQRSPKKSREMPGETVMQVQTLLSKLGYDSGPIDGIMGERTREAIRDFQREIGMPETGEIDDKLVAQMESVIQRRRRPAETIPRVAEPKPRIREKLPPTRYVLPKMPEALPSEVLQPKYIFRKVKESVYVLVTAKSVEALEQKIDMAQGSAVAVSASHLLTNYHVIEDRPIIVVLQGDRIMAAQVAAKDEKRDMCVLTVQGSNLTPVGGVRRFEELEVGERVYSVGAPYGLEKTLGEGLISGRHVVDEQQVIQTSAPISAGSSGGGLFDSSGNLIGITTFIFEHAQNLNFAIAAEQYWK